MYFSIYAASVLCLGIGVAASASASPTTAQNPPAAGLWEISLALEGAPAGAAARKGTACLSKPALEAGPEQALLDAAAQLPGAGRAPLRCQALDIQRAAAKSSWQAQCDGPMGKLLGSGSGVLGEESVELQQTFSIERALIKRNLKQTLAARRTGSC
jgi:hypothetical protein